MHIRWPAMIHANSTVSKPRCIFWSLHAKTFCTNSLRPRGNGSPDVALIQSTRSRRLQRIPKSRWQRSHNSCDEVSAISSTMPMPALPAVKLPRLRGSHALIICCVHITGPSLFFCVVWEVCVNLQLALHIIITPAAIAPYFSSPTCISVCCLPCYGPCIKANNLSSLSTQYHFRQMLYISHQESTVTQKPSNTLFRTFPFPAQMQSIIDSLQRPRRKLNSGYICVCVCVWTTSQHVQPAYGEAGQRKSSKP